MEKKRLKKLDDALVKLEKEVYEDLLTENSQLTRNFLKELRSRIVYCLEMIRSKYPG